MAAVGCGAPATAKPKLHAFAFSSCSYRVRLALAYKGIDFEYIPLNFRSTAEKPSDMQKEDYALLNPAKYAPVLEIDGTTLTESIAILEYLEETRPERPLLPKDPKQRFYARRIAEVVNSGIQPLQNLSVVNYVGDKIGKEAVSEWNKYFITKGLTALEKVVAVSKGKYAVGDEVTFADLCIYPQLFGSRKRGVDTCEFPNLSAVEAALNELDFVKACDVSLLPDAPPA